MAILRWTSIAAILVAVAGDAPILEPQALGQSAVYVWQEDWSASVRDAMAAFASDTDAYWVLAGDIIGDGDFVYLHVNSADWESIDHGIPVTPVVRLDVSVLEPMEAGNVAEVAGAVLQIAHEWTQAAEQWGAQVRGLQLDFDCPTSRLPTYAELIQRVRGQARTPVSITALPDWLRDAAFIECLSQCDYYVLQVHSLERPDGVADDVQIFNEAAAARQIGLADGLGNPYFVALPTYAYTLYFDQAGDFRGLVAEQRPPVWASDMTQRRVETDPDAVTRTIRRLAHARLNNLAGVVWFRLPVGKESHNWDRETFRSVLNAS